MLAKNAVVGGTWGLGSGRSVTKRAILFRASMIVVWAGTSDLVSEPIGQTTTTALLLLVLSLAAYPLGWNREAL